MVQHKSSFLFSAIATAYVPQMCTQNEGTLGVETMSDHYHVFGTRQRRPAGRCMNSLFQRRQTNGGRTLLYGRTLNLRSFSDRRYNSISTTDTARYAEMAENDYWSRLNLQHFKRDLQIPAFNYMPQKEKLMFCLCQIETKVLPTFSLINLHASPLQCIICSSIWFFALSVLLTRVEFQRDKHLQIYISRKVINLWQYLTSELAGVDCITKYFQYNI